MELHARRLQIHPGRLVTGETLRRLETAEVMAHSRAFILDIDHGTLTLYSFHLALKAADLIIEGEQLTLFKSRDTLYLEHLRLTLNALPGLHIESRRATCTSRVCHLVHVEGTGCPHHPAGYALSAENVLVHESRDIDVTRAVLYFENTPIAAIPWLRIRPPGAAGFLLPRMGYSPTGGWILGPSGHLPLSEQTAIQGHLALRSYQGFETRTRLHAPHLEVVLDHLFDTPLHHTRTRVDTTLPLSHSSLNMKLDLTTRGRHIIDELAEHPLDRAVSHTTSHLLLTLNLAHAINETHVELLQPFDSGEASAVLTNIISSQLSLPSVPLTSFLWPSLDVGFTRYGFLGRSAFIDAEGDALVHSFSRFYLTPSVRLVGRLGPLATTVTTTSLHQAWFIDDTSSTPTSHAGAVFAGFDLPLYRRFRILRHQIKPYLRYHITPFVYGSPPRSVMSPNDLLETGHGAEIGISNRLRTHQSRIIALDVYERLSLPGFGEPMAFSYLAAKGHIGPPVLNLNIDGALDHATVRPSVLGAYVSSHTDSRGRIDFGGRWYGPGNGPHRTFSSTPSAPWHLPKWASSDDERIELFADLVTPVVRHLSAVGGIRIGAWPKKTLHALWYGIVLESRCNCIAMGIHGLHRINTPIPDVMTSLIIRNF